MSRRSVALAGLLFTTGVAHFTRPAGFDSIVPRRLGSPRRWTYASGAAELACAAGLMIPGTRRLAGWASAALFVAVFPANAKMAADAWPTRHDRPGYVAGTIVRMPVQIPLVSWAVSVAREGRR
jgi:uncharacterized membrane protein